MKRLGEIKVGKRLSEDEMKQIKGGNIGCYRWSSSGFGYDCSCRGRSPYIEC